MSWIDVVLIVIGCALYRLPEPEVDDRTWPECWPICRNQCAQCQFAQNARPWY